MTFALPTGLARSWIIVAAAASLYWGLDWTVARNRGLTRAVTDEAPAAQELVSERVETIDLANLESVLAGRTRASVSWRGVWEVPAPAFYALSMDSRGASSWRIDGELAHQVDPSQPSFPREVWLDEGFHTIEITHGPDLTAPNFGVTVAVGTERPHPLNPDELKTRLPRNPWLRQATVVITWVLGWIVLILLALALRRSVAAIDARGIGRAPAALPTIGRAAAWGLLAGIIVYGALLRIDAITVRYGTVTSPAWVAAIQTRTFLEPESIRHPWFPWVPAKFVEHPGAPPSPYFSDPYSYLQFARNMQSLYGAHDREPIFIFAVKLMLPVFDNQDITVSFTSTAFALLGIWFTYLLGASAWSRVVGLIAALALAMDRDAVWFASGGWRDDSYIATVPLGAWLILRSWRSWRSTPRFLSVGPFGRIGRLNIEVAVLDAVALGAVAGMLILVRFMAFSFLIPGGLILLWVARGGWRRRMVLSGVALAIAVGISSPYFINCWRVFGDPLYTFNFHGNIYRAAEGRADKPPTSTFTYVSEKILARPFASIDTIVQGVTTYPFNNKWIGLESWRHGLGSFASTAAVAGLAILAFFPSGRLLLLVAFTSLLPFSFTWRVDPNPRFTAHLYPFLLVAAAVALEFAARLLFRVIDPARRLAIIPPTARQSDSPRVRSTWIPIALIAICAATTWWFVARVSPQLVFAESLAHGEDASIPAGAGTSALLGAGWLPGAVGSGNVRMRVSLDQGALRLRLPTVDDYRATVRLELFPRPIGNRVERELAVDVLLNGAHIGGGPIAWNPDRVGALEVILPRAHVRDGMNELTIRLQRPPSPPIDVAPQSRVPGLSQSDAFGLWLVRVVRVPG